VGICSIKNNNFRNQISVLEGQLDECQNQTRVLENQVSEYQNQIDQFEEQTSVFQTRIVGVSITGSSFPIVGLSVMKRVNVTVQNFGKYDVKDLNVTVRHRSGTGQTEWEQIWRVKEGKKQRASMQVWHTFSCTPDGYAVTLMCGDRLLDELITDARGYPPR
jgi:tellurite resistance-related uncharacterized protein